MDGRMLAKHSIVWTDAVTKFSIFSLCRPERLQNHTNNADCIQLKILKRLCEFLNFSLRGWNFVFRKHFVISSVTSVGKSKQWGTYITYISNMSSAKRVRLLNYTPEHPPRKLSLWSGGLFSHRSPTLFKPKDTSHQRFYVDYHLSRNCLPGDRGNVKTGARYPAASLERPWR